MNEKLTTEQREELMTEFVECVKSALATGQGHLVNCKRFDKFLTANTAEDEYNASKYGTFQPAQQIWKDWMMSHARSIGTDFEEWFRVRYAAEDDDPAIEAKNEFERGIIL